MTTARTINRLILLTGLLLTGQGLLVVTGILDHETPLVTSIVLIIVGVALLAWLARSSRAGRAGAASSVPDAGSVPASSTARAVAVALLGLTAVSGVVLYNLRTRSDYSIPEIAIVTYGILLLLASGHLDRRLGPGRVGTFVAYSFPLVLAPLSLYAINAALTAQVGATPLRVYTEYFLVAPMAAAIKLIGLTTSTAGNTVHILTPRGSLYLTVGVVCAGLYAGALFLGVFSLFAWEARTPPKRLALYLALGLVGLHAANVVRLIALGLVGYQWGAGALQAFHEHAGWVLFLAWAIVYWYLVLRRFEGPEHAAA